MIATRMLRAKHPFRVEVETTGLDRLAGGGQDVVTVQQVERALAQVEAGESEEARAAAMNAAADAARLTGQVNHELAAWGHAGHEVALERARPFYGDPGVLRLTFWCETCHVSQMMLCPR